MKIEKGDLLPIATMIVMIVIIILAYAGVSFMTPQFALSSTAFANNGSIPTTYSCDGDGKSPPLNFAHVPTNAKSIVLTVQDLDSPKTNFVHWVVYDIDPMTTLVEAGALPTGSIEALNSTNKTGYVAFCPDTGTHRYLFTAYASSINYHFVQAPTIEGLKKVMKWQVIEKAELVGKYTRAPKI